jgi:hypothetical protein
MKKVIMLLIKCVELKWVVLRALLDIDVNQLKNKSRSKAGRRIKDLSPKVSF